MPTAPARHARVSRRALLRFAGLTGGAALLVRPGRAWAADKPDQRLNLLLITADDLNCDSVGAFGGRVADATPNIDRLAKQGMRFEHAHVTIAVCQPCRSVLLTGRYPHRSGGEGFHKIRDLTTPTLWERLGKAGYRTGLLGKETHCLPKPTDKPDVVATGSADLGRGRDAKQYYAHAKQFFADAAKAGRPFFLMANSHDPHRPYAGSDQERRWGNAKIAPPSRTFKPDEIAVPDFLPELPEVRREIAEYYSSARRCDDTVGAILKALDESGLADNTLVMFLSDNGIACPFAKTNCYLNSTRTPWIVRWPGRVEPGSTDREHFISGIDYLPTALEAAGLPAVPGVDGRSFLPLLQGQAQPGRERAFTQFHQTSARRRFPMRCVQNKRFGYIFNPWADGERAFKNESQSGRTWAAMVRAAADDPAIAARMDLFSHRVFEELYDFEADPDALKNLAGDPKYKAELNAMRKALRDWMVATKDPALEAFDHRDDPAALARFMEAQNAAAGAIPRNRRKKAKAKSNSKRKRGS